MRGVRTLGRTVPILLALSVSCAPASDSEVGQVATELGSDVEILIDTEDAVIGQISDLVIGPDGTVYAVDRQAGQIHAVDSAGHRLPSIGRPGAGPGEFGEPTAVEVVGDTLFVVDSRNNRLQGLSLAGAPLLTRPLPPGYYPPSIGAGTQFVRPLWGVDTVLAVIYRPDLTRVAGIGRIVGEQANVVSPARMKREIQEGVVPTVFLNTAEAVVGPDSSTWLYVPARGTVQRFDAEGREQWSVEVNEPEREELKATFMAENGAKPHGAFALLSYVLDITIVKNDAWLLLGHSRTGQAAVRMLSSRGELGERIEFPGVSGVDEVAADLERGYVYFVRPDAAQLIRILRRPGG